MSFNETLNKKVSKRVGKYTSATSVAKDIWDCIRGLNQVNRALLDDTWTAEMILNACVNVRTLLTIRYEKEDNSAILKAEKEFLKSDDVKRSLIYQSSLMIQTLTSPLFQMQELKSMSDQYVACARAFLKSQNINLRQAWH